MNRWVKKARWQCVKTTIQHFFKKRDARMTPSIWIGALQAGKGQSSQCSDKQMRAWSVGEGRSSAASGPPELAVGPPELGMVCTAERCCQLPDQGKWSPNNTLSHMYWRDHRTKAVDRSLCGGWHSHSSYRPISSAPFSSSDGLRGMWVHKTNHSFHFHVILQRAVLTL